MFERFKENVNKYEYLEKFNEILNFFFYYRFSLLAEAWAVPQPLQIFRVRGTFPLFPPGDAPDDDDA